MSDELNIGDKLGAYEIVEEIGRGGMGVVYKANETSLRRVAALKVLPAKLAEDAAFVERFTREARAVAQLEHPNVVGIYQMGEDGGRRYIAMQFVKGESLDELIKREGPLDVLRALEIARQVADALAAAHRRGIVHRDIKPQNIMIDEDGRPKVMDFGIAKIVEDQPGLTRAGDMIGTPAYMPPEQCRGTEIDGRADIYALGVVLYQMLAGRVPFRGETPVATIQKILFEHFEPIQTLNPAAPISVNVVLEKALSKDPAGRYATAEKMAEDLLRVSAAVSASRASSELPTPGPMTALTPDPRAITPAAATPPPRVPELIAAGGASFHAGPPPPEGPGWFGSVGKGLVIGLAIVGLLAVAGIWFIQEPSAPPKEDASAKPASSASRAEEAAPEPTGKTRTRERASDDSADNAARADKEKPAPRAPVIEWSRGPDEGERVRETPVKLTWRIRNDAIADGFLVGLNDRKPKVRTTDSFKSFDLTEPGDYEVTVIPLGADGERGEAIRRSFEYKPEETPKPTLAAAAQPATTPRAFQTIPPEATEPATSSISSLLQRAIEMLGRAHSTQETAEIQKPLLDAVDKNDPLARMTYALAQQKGELGFPRQEQRARTLAAKTVPDLERMAERDDPNAQYLLGRACQEGLGAKRNGGRAAELYQKSAAAGNVGAMKALADLFAAPEPPGPRPAESAYWLERAAKKGDPEAMRDFALALQKGSGVERDPREAARWLQRAAEAGSVDAMRDLGAALDSGQGARRDPAEAVHWYREAARAGDVAAKNNLAVLTLGGEGTERDERAAAAMFKEAADAGSVEAMTNLGLVYEQGRGVHADPRQAMGWYQKAADAGDPQAMHNLAVMYDEGTAGRPSVDKALEWHRRAADAGNAESMNDLGWFYESGVGVARDVDQAIVWYRRGAAAGAREAVENLRRLGVERQ